MAFFAPACSLRRTRDICVPLTAERSYASAPRDLESIAFWGTGRLSHGHHSRRRWQLLLYMVSLLKPFSCREPPVVYFAHQFRFAASGTRKICEP